jgi:hypothetical protein
MNLIHGTTGLRGKKFLLKAAIAMVATGALALGAMAPANAAEIAPSPVAAVPTTTVTAAELSQIRLASKSASGSAGSVTFDYAAAVRSGVAVQVATDFATGITAGGGVAINAPATASAPSALLQKTAAASNCQGRNGYSTYWWGTQIRLDSCNTNVVVNALWGGVGVSALAGILSSETGVGAVAGGVAAAILTIGAAGLGICGSWGTGTYINQVWASAPGCWAQ